MLNKYILIFFLFCGDVSAQGQNFYDKDFAKDPLAEKKNQQLDSPPSESISLPSSVTPAVQNSPEEKKELLDNNETKNEGKIKTIALILDGTSNQAATTLMLKYLEILNKYETIEPSTVTFVGREFAIPTSDWSLSMNKVALIGAQIKVELNVSNIAHKSLPVWLIELEDKTIALEGLQSPEKFISKGELVLPQFVDMQAD